MTLKGCLQFLLLLLLVLHARGHEGPSSSASASVSCTYLPNAAPRARAVNVFDGFTFDDELDHLRVRMQGHNSHWAVFEFNSLPEDEREAGIQRLAAALALPA